jgi:hypothetical protein
LFLVDFEEQLEHRSSSDGGFAAEGVEGLEKKAFELRSSGGDGENTIAVAIEASRQRR